MIRSVISDLGRVILWFDNQIFFNKMTAYCALSAEKIREYSHGDVALIESFDLGRVTPEEFYHEVISRLGAKIGMEEFYAVYSDVFRLIAPAFEAIKKLRGRHRLILLSNTDVKRFGFIKSRFPEIFIFDGYVLSYELGWLKPDRRIFEAALKMAGSPPSECLFIDDIEENTQAAAALGMRTITFRPETDLEKALQEAGLIF
jgi:FMN phosphatase YigB (HAD superfamily)